jgi:hypothetical protein
VTKSFPSTVGTFGLLLADRTALALDLASLPAIDVLILLLLEPEKAPYVICSRRIKIPAPAQTTSCWSNVPNFG